MLETISDEFVACHRAMAVDIDIDIDDLMLERRKPLAYCQI